MNDQDIIVLNTYKYKHNEERSNVGASCRQHGHEAIMLTGDDVPNNK